ncbi:MULTISPECIES: hypothetical protein [unclassified Cupriavidus]|uniref:hypothetical protein n=1 Tax=Cupriavidus sp. H19C3 TaxID=3241603 RepID=UPI003BF783E3
MIHHAAGDCKAKLKNRCNSCSNMQQKTALPDVSGQRRHIGKLLAELQRRL